MDLATLTSFFQWCTFISVGLLIFWTVIMIAMPDLVYRMHSKMFPMARETFNVVIYSFLGLFKIFVIVFNIIPYVALRILS